MRRENTSRRNCIESEFNSSPVVYALSKKVQILNVDLFLLLKQYTCFRFIFIRAGAVKAYGIYDQIVFLSTILVTRPDCRVKVYLHFGHVRQTVVNAQAVAKEFRRRIQKFANSSLNWLFNFDLAMFFNVK